MDTVWLPSKVDEDAGPSSQSTSTVVAASNIPARLRVLDEADTAFAQAAAETNASTRRSSSVAPTSTARECSPAAPSPAILTGPAS